ncbi:lysylphosphatidylglycerol synthase domain-containing protein [Flavitalea antarctica]
MNLLYFAAQLAELSKNIKLIIKYVLGPVVFCILAVSIYHQVQNQPSWQQSFEQILASLRSDGLVKMCLVVMLMFFNWGIEARKWQLSLRSLSHISFVRSFKAVFTGTTMAFFTPNRIGEYFGRILYIPEGRRLQAISLTIVCSMAQLLITIVAGVGGLIFLKEHIRDQLPDPGSVLFWLQLVLYVSIACGIMLTVFYFRLEWLVRGLERISFIEKYVRYVKVLDEFNTTMLARILLLSFLRYIVFVMQYYLLFDVFEVNVNWWECLWVISVMFIVLAIAPTVAFLTDLGIRAKASIELVQFFSSNVVGILATSLTIWLINLVIPALIGSLLILGIKITNYQSGQNNTNP